MLELAKEQIQRFHARQRCALLMLTIGVVTGLAGCSATRIERAEIRTYPNGPTASSPHVDFETRDDPAALVVDPRRAEAFLDAISSGSVPAELVVEAPESARNRVLFLVPKGEDDAVIVMCQPLEESDDVIMLRYSASSVGREVYEEEDVRIEFVGQPSAMEIIEWTARRVELWDEMLESAPEPEDGF